MYRWGSLIGWISVLFALLIGAAFGLFAILAGPPPSGEPIWTSSVFYVATLLPLVALLGLIVMRRALVSGAALLGISGALIASHSLFLAPELNVIAAFLGTLMVLSSGLIIAGRSSATNVG